MGLLCMVDVVGNRNCNRRFISKIGGVMQNILVVSRGYSQRKVQMADWYSRLKELGAIKHPVKYIIEIKGKYKFHFMVSTGLLERTTKMEISGIRGEVHQIDKKTLAILNSRVKEI